MTPRVAAQSPRCCGASVVRTPVTTMTARPWSSVSDATNRAVCHFGWSSSNSSLSGSWAGLYRKKTRKRTKLKGDLLATYYGTSVVSVI